MLNAWRPSTKRQYASHLFKWEEFTNKHHIPLFSPTIAQVCTFLRTIAADGSAHGALNTARCALGAILPKYYFNTIGKQTEVIWVVKSVYEQNPPKPRYNSFWNVANVFNLFKEWPENNFLSLKFLTFKLNMLLLLVSSQRGQTIVNLDVKGMILSKDKVTFKMKKLLKHNKVGDPLDTIHFHAYHPNHKLCVVRTIKFYLSTVGPHRKTNTQLLLSYAKPFQPIKRDSIARWTMQTLELAGIDTKKYKSHSTRGASASATRKAGVRLNLIMKHAGWRCEQSFARHYNKNIDRELARHTANDMIATFDN